MGTALVIVESPAKAKTINKYLGKGYVVKSSVGHIRDLPKKSPASKNKNNTCIPDQHTVLIKRMGIDPFHSWKARYEILPGKEKLVTELRALAEEADHVYLATDLDREGEAIAWHLREAIGGDEKRFRRVVFNEITRNAVTQAFENPVVLNMNRVNAQQARRFMDRIVGYMVSPLLWKKIARGLSAGRVQSVAVRLVVEREREIKSFMPAEYWELHVALQTSQAAQLMMKVTHQQEKPFKPAKQQQLQAAISILEHTDYIVSNRDDKITTSKPGSPFTTSTLQQAASLHLGYRVKKTMLLAQRLYEAGHITYMRTDSTHLSRNALNMARCYISAAFGHSYLPTQPKEYVSKNNSQEAHEAIRPSDVSALAEQLNNMEAEAQKLYQLIWRQFVACQMKPAQYNYTILTVNAGEFQLSAHGRQLMFDGWTKVMPTQHTEKDKRTLPTVKEGNNLTLNKILPSQHFTKPPARYSEASLVKELEKRGIGRPSTYVSIISTIQERGYVHADNRRFYAEKIGEIVTDRLEENFSELMSYDFTAKMEATLDQVATNQQDWKSVLDAFFSKFSQQLKNAEQNPVDGGMRLNQMIMTSINCLVCDRPMGIRTASTGVFLGCSGYQLPPKDRCKNTIHLIPESETLNRFTVGDEETNALRARRRCVKCRTAMDNYVIDSKRKIHVCGKNPLCDGYNIEQGEFIVVAYNGRVVECEKCGFNMQLKFGRFGKYIACTNNNCKNTRKILRNGDVAPPKEDPVLLPELPCYGHSDAYFVLREGAVGVFLAANTFPKYRETRKPLVAELARFRERLPVKLQYLADAPIEDDEGNSTLVRFSRKTKQQYISSEKDGKATGWTAFYVNGKWQVNRKSSGCGP
ncbi:DNA topoisomerase 1 [Candidatus Moranella endobia PCVAL]|uniref:DNA topoisomerase 1 n=1 Tax=Moranella endobia (strain PCIT) TaxID=903503 RepID=F7XXV3_MOREP|nr:type I DNA topoisomerase [Candidatus Moranella endobia]AEI74929.1 DNA topoisomerase I [Candidatus Moranella endobia PCIT]AGJ61177.1 DNA topoisomerase 1 [Candidatus Moranella endobia PCVAL]